MPGCTIKRGSCPQFEKLCAKWKRVYPNLEKDLQKAFAAISQDISANKAWRIKTGNPKVELYKYRQNSSDIRQGQNYGWRIDALFHRESGYMYPIIVYPKTEWADADTTTIKTGIREILTYLGICISEGCDGLMTQVEPVEISVIGGDQHAKTKCGKCGTIHWKCVVEIADAG